MWFEERSISTMAGAMSAMFQDLKRRAWYLHYSLRIRVAYCQAGRRENVDAAWVRGIDARAQLLSPVEYTRDMLSSNWSVREVSVD